MIALALFGIVSVICIAQVIYGYIEAWERIEKAKIDAQQCEIERTEK